MDSVNIEQDEGWEILGPDRPLGSAPVRLPPPLPTTAPLLLNTHELAWEAVEHLVAALALEVEQATEARLYGRPGQDQQGIDVVAFFDGKPTSVYQAKRYTTFTAADLRKAVVSYAGGRRPFGAHRLVVVTTASVADTKVDEELVALRKRHSDLVIDLWGRQQLSDILHNVPHLVRRYFGPATMEVFCRPLTAEDLPAASGAAKQPIAVARGRASHGSDWPSVEACDPLKLRVHSISASPGGQPGRPTPELTPYMVRAHDVELRNALEPAVAGHASVFAVLTGESTTGKTRTVYEALLQMTPHWSVARPSSARDLADLLSGPPLPARTVLWLDEAQRFLDGEMGSRAAVLLEETLSQGPGLLAVGTLWAEYWETYATSSGSPGIYAQVRHLLSGPNTKRIRVPDCLTARERQTLRDLAREAKDVDRVAYALDAGSDDGRVLQRLTYGPELVDAYTNGDLFRPTEYAVLTAAIDARRLGHHEPLPLELITAAADGYLTDRRRPGDPHWASTALRAVCAGERQDGTRTDVNRALTAMYEVRTRSGSPVANYEPDEYLDQHARLHRQGCLGPAALWGAFADHVGDAQDLTRLAEAARTRGLYRMAAGLYRQAVQAGSVQAARRLGGGAVAVPVGGQHVVDWVARHVPLDNPRALAVLLRELPISARGILLGRSLANQTALHDPQGLAALLHQLRQIPEEAAGPVLHDLAHRAAEGVPTTHTYAVASLLRALGNADETDAVRKLAGRAAAHEPLDDPRTLAGLLKALRRAEAAWAARVLLERTDISCLDLTEAGAVASLLNELLLAPAPPDVITALLQHLPASYPGPVASLLKALQTADPQAAQALADRTAADSPITDPKTVADTLRQLKEAGQKTAIRVMLSRNPAQQATLASPTDSLRLLPVLKQVRAFGSLDVLARRIAEALPLTDPAIIAAALRAFRENTRHHTAAEILLDRRPGDSVELNNPKALSTLLRELEYLLAHETVGALLHRDPISQVDLTDPVGLYDLICELRRLNAHCTARNLALRAAAHFPLSDPATVAQLLTKLQQAAVPEAIDRLMSRNIAVHGSLRQARGLAQLLRVLQTLNHPASNRHIIGLLRACSVAPIVPNERDAELVYQLHTSHGMPESDDLLNRIANAGLFTTFLRLAPPSTRASYRYGRNPDGRPTGTWSWP
ncbi:hypothetical protein [Streptomyces nigrescens]